MWHILFSPGVEDQAQRKNDANLMLNDGNDYENGLFCRTQFNTMVWTFINGRDFGTCRFRFRYQCVQLGYLCLLLSIYTIRYTYKNGHTMFGFLFRVWFSNFIIKKCVIFDEVDFYY